MVLATLTDLRLLTRSAEAEHSWRTQIQLRCQMVFLLALESGLRKQPQCWCSYMDDARSFPIHQQFCIYTLLKSQLSLSLSPSFPPSLPPVKTYIDWNPFLQLHLLGVVVKANCVACLFHNLSVHDQFGQTRLPHVAVAKKHRLEGLRTIDMDIVQLHLCREDADSLVQLILDWYQPTLDCLKLPFLLPSALATPLSRNTSLGTTAPGLALAMASKLKWWSSDFCGWAQNAMGGAHDCAMANGGEVPTHVSSIEFIFETARVYVDILWWIC